MERRRGAKNSRVPRGHGYSYISVGRGARTHETERLAPENKEDRTWADSTESYLQGGFELGGRRAGRCMPAVRVQLHAAASQTPLPQVRPHLLRVSDAGHQA